MRWPYEWFFDGKFDYINFHVEDSPCDEDDHAEHPAEHHVNWQHLEFLGWDSCYVDSIGLKDIPCGAGVYVVAHEWESLPLYVGQSTNLATRINPQSHHKISKIIELWEDAPMGYHQKDNVRGEVRVFWKIIKKPYFMNSLERSLILCESIAIGLLCPIAQGNIEDLVSNNWAIGMQFY